MAIVQHVHYHLLTRWTPRWVLPHVLAPAADLNHDDLALADAPRSPVGMAPLDLMGARHSITPITPKVWPLVFFSAISCRHSLFADP